MSDLWMDLSNVEGERRHEEVTALRVATASLWPILAQAMDRTDFANRLELVRPRLVAEAAKVNPDALQAVEASFVNDFEAMLKDRTQKQAALQKQADAYGDWNRRPGLFNWAQASPEEQCAEFHRLDTSYDTDPRSPSHHNNRCPIHGSDPRHNPNAAVNKEGSVKVAATITKCPLCHRGPDTDEHYDEVHADEPLKPAFWDPNERHDWGLNWDKESPSKEGTLSRKQYLALKKNAMDGGWLKHVPSDMMTPEELHNHLREHHGHGDGDDDNRWHADFATDGGKKLSFDEYSTFPRSPDQDKELHDAIHHHWHYGCQDEACGNGDYDTHWHHPEDATSHEGAKGPSPKVGGLDKGAAQGPQVHTFESTGQAYDASNTSDRIKHGDILHVPSEGVVGYLHQAWPVAVTEAHGEFHQLKEPQNTRGPEGEGVKICRSCHGTGKGKPTDNHPYRKEGDTSCWGCSGVGHFPGESLSEVQAAHNGWVGARRIARENGYPEHGGQVHLGKSTPISEFGHIFDKVAASEDWPFGEDDSWGDDHYSSCPQCGGDAYPLGALGHRVHYRCRDCGAEHSLKTSDPETHTAATNLYEAEYEEGLKCPKCPKTFYSDAKRSEHVSSAHGKNKAASQSDPVDSEDESLLQRVSSSFEALPEPEKRGARRVLSAIFRRGANDENLMEKCPICGKEIPAGEMAAHMKKEHPHEVIKPEDEERARDHAKEKEEKGKEKKEGALDDIQVDDSDENTSPMEDMNLPDNLNPKTSRLEVIQTIALDLKYANPGLTEPQAIHLATQTVDRYPHLLVEARGGADYVDGEVLTNCTQCGKDTFSEGSHHCHNCGFVKA